MAVDEREVKDILDGLDAPESTTKDELTALVTVELEKREKAKDAGTSEAAAVRAEIQELRDEQRKLADKLIEERDIADMERKTVKDITDADKDAAVRHAGELSSRVEKAIKTVPYTVAGNFEVVTKVIGEDEQVRPASDLDRMYMFGEHDGVYEDDYIKAWKRAMDDAYTVAVILKRPVQRTKVWQHYCRLNPEFEKAMATVSGSEGEDWVPTGYSSQILDLVRTPHRLIEQHPRVPMPTASYVMPMGPGDMTAYIAGEPTTDDAANLTATTPTTANKTLTAKTLAISTKYSKVLDEDSIVPILPQLRNGIALSIAGALDDAMVRGDVTATHHDTGYTVATNDVRRLWEGYVECALTYDGSTNLVDLTGITFDKVLQLQGLMEQYGAQGNETLMWVTGYDGYRQLKSLRDAQNNNIMVDFGDGRNDQSVTSLDGIQVLTTDKVRADLNVSGIYDGTTTGGTNLLLVYKPAFVIGDRRSLTLETDTDIQTQQSILVATLRMACTNVYEASTHFTVAMGYDF